MNAPESTSYKVTAFEFGIIRNSEDCFVQTGMRDISKTFAGHLSEDSRKPAKDGSWLMNSMKPNGSSFLSGSAPDGDSFSVGGLWQVSERRILPNNRRLSALLVSQSISLARKKFEFASLVGPSWSLSSVNKPKFRSAVRPDETMLCSSENSVGSRATSSKRSASRSGAEFPMAMKIHHSTSEVGVCMMSVWWLERQFSVFCFFFVFCRV